MKVKQDRRKELRYRYSGLVELQLCPEAGGSQPIVAGLTGLVEDLSESGACIQVDRPLAIGSRLIIKTRDRTEVEAVVRNVRNSRSAFFLGVEFTHAFSAPTAERPVLVSDDVSATGSRATASSRLQPVEPERIHAGAKTGVPSSRSFDHGRNRNEFRQQIDDPRSPAVRSYITFASVLQQIYKLRQRWFGNVAEDAPDVPEQQLSPLPSPPDDPLRLFDDMPTAAIVLDLDFQISYANTKFIQLAGSTRMLETRSFEQFIAPEDLDRVLECARAAMAGPDTSRSLDFQLLDAKGTRLDIASWWRHAPGRHRMVVQCIDVTEDRRNQNDLIALLNGTERVDEPIGLADWTWDVASETVECSRNYARLYGLDIKTVRQDRASWMRMIHPEDLPRVQQALTEAIAGSAIVRVEFRAKRPNGCVAVMAARGRVIFDRDGQPIRVIGKTLDITSRANARSTDPANALDAVVHVPVQITGINDVSVHALLG